MWQIELSPRAERALQKLDRPVASRVSRALLELAHLESPEARCKALTGPMVGLWRFRVGDYRAILDIDRGRLVVVALDIGHRSEIYE